MLRYCLILSVFLALGSLDVSAASRGISIVDKDGQTVGAYGASYALLIGASDYTAGWPDLASVKPELERVGELLEKKGFAVTTVFDPDGDQMKDAFEKFLDDYGYDKSNRLIVYYSGHGYTRDGGNKGYLVPVDAPNPLKDERGFLRRAYAMTDLIAIARRMEANHVLFLFDSCFSGTIFKTRALPETPDLITRLTSKPVREFITAGDAGEEVPAKSVFTPAFIDSLEYGLGDLNSDGFVTGTELGLYLQSTVPKHAKQTPQFGKINDYELSRGDFVFGVKSLVPEQERVDGSGSAPMPQPDLSGSWSGRYYYEDGRNSVPFVIDLYDTNGSLEGRVSEPATFGAPGARSLYANLAGKVDGKVMTFRKTYDGSGGQRHSVDYQGELDADLMSAKGRWRIPGASGRFEIYRRTQ
ncbi:MAG: caspase family protein [Pseudomonadales bacterium]|nr:caspase family protein [Pseudomonadales bacterium]